MNLADLKAPFAPNKISWRVGSTTKDKTKGMALAYIDARDVQDRLDEVCGIDGWQCRYIPMHDKKTVCEIGVLVSIAPAIEHGAAYKEWIWKSDGAGDSDIEAEKGALSDAFKRAAVRWGVGRYLYDLDSPWVELDTYEKNGAVFAKGIKAHEYKRLEALLVEVQKPTQREAIHGVSTLTPTKDGTQKTVQTPLAWLTNWTEDVPKLNREELDDFTESQSARLVRVKALEPEAHGKLMEAIQKRQEELF